MSIAFDGFGNLRNLRNLACRLCLWHFMVRKSYFPTVMHIPMQRDVMVHDLADALALPLFLPKGAVFSKARLIRDYLI